MKPLFLLAFATLLASVAAAQNIFTYPIGVQTYTFRKHFPNGIEKEITVEKLTRLDSLLRFENEGIPRPDSSRGEFVVTFLYNYPNSLTAEQEDILSKYVSTLNN